MAKANGSTKVGSPLTLALRRLGCTYCDICHGFMYPDHIEHVTAGAFDTHDSRYTIVLRGRAAWSRDGRYDIIETEAA